MPTFKATIETEVDVDFEVYCARCNTGLCSQSEGGNIGRRNYPYVNVQPCTVCLDDRSEESYSKGFDEGYSQGGAEGFDSGFCAGSELLTDNLKGGCTKC